MEQQGSNVLEHHKQQESNIRQEGNRVEETRAKGELDRACNSQENCETAVEENKRHVNIAKTFSDEASKRDTCDPFSCKYRHLEHFQQLINPLEERLSIVKEVGNRAQEGLAYEGIGIALKSLGDFKQAIKYHEQHLSIAKEVNDKAGEGRAYGNLGNAYQSLGDFKQGINYQEQRLSIAKEVGDRAEEGRAYGNLGNAYQELGDFKQAIMYHQQDLSIAKEVGDSAAEGGAYGNIGVALNSLGDFQQAMKYHEQGLSIDEEVNDRAGEGRAYGNLANSYQGVGDFKQAIKYHEQEVSIAKEVGDRVAEGRAYGGMGNAYHGLGEFIRAINYHNKRLGIAKEVGDRVGEGRAYGNLGNACDSLSNFKQAIKYHEQDVSIAKEVGDRAGEGRAYGNLGNAYQGLGDFKQAIKYHEQRLCIAKEVGDRAGEGGAYGNLCACFQRLSNSRRAMEFHKQHLSIAKEVGDRYAQRVAYLNAADIYCSLGDLARSIEYILEGLRIAKEIGDKSGKGKAYCGLAATYLQLRNFKAAKKYLKLHLSVAKEIGDSCGEGCAYSNLGWSCELSGCLHEALDFYQCSVNVLNAIRLLLQFEDTWKVIFRDKHQGVYTSLFRVLLKLSKTDEALSAAEQGRAQALVDLMASTYGLELPLSSSLDYKEIMQDIAIDTSSQIVFVALENKKINLWVLCKGKDAQLRQIDVQGRDAFSFLMGLTKAAFKEIRCDCSLEVPTLTDALQVTKASGQTGQPYNKTNSLQRLYRCIFSPIATLLKGDEVVIVPDGPLALAPCAAFLDEASRYLSESFRIRMIPSLTSLKLIADCPNDYHSKAGALLVGDPCLEEITNIFGKPRFNQLPYAKKEVEMIGEILNTTPLTGKGATKDDVLKRIGSVALVHIAAHGKMGSGEVFLAPNRDRKYSDPEDKDYIMKIADLHAVQIRARLVVLSCPHSGEGEIKAEGVVGIARAFLGAGARSVLVSLGCIYDEATMEFMKSFYQHIRNGRSASVSLNQAMKCLRKSSKFNEVKFWAPFVLIGDDVTLDFAEKQQEHCWYDIF